MPGKAKTVLITAGYGNQARQAIPRLAHAGLQVRAMRRSDPPGPGPRDLGATEVIVGDASDPADALKAMEGVDAVYHVGPTFHPRERDMAINMIDQAERAGVEHFIFSSVLHPIFYGLPQHAIKRGIEEYLAISKLNFTILQPSDYMQGAVGGVQPEEDQYLTPYGSNHREALVDLDDVAQVLVRIVEEGPLHYGATYELTDGHNPTKTDLVDGISQAFGREFKLVQLPADSFYRTEMYGDVDEDTLRYQMYMLRTVLNWYEHHDFVGNGNVLAMLLGRQPTTWVEFLRKHFGLEG